ncbi:MAG: hypothetical protein ABI874_01425 [Chloroflexota bacterium]
MNKKFALLPYQNFYDRWRGLSLLVAALSLVLLVFAPPSVPAYRTVLTLAAGLGALIFVLGFALSLLAFVAVGKKGVAVQLPLWRAHIPFTSIHTARISSLDLTAPGKWREHDRADVSAVVLELTLWPQPQSVLRFWLGRLVLNSAIVLPVSDVLSLRRAVDVGLAQMKEQRLSRRADSAM